MKLQNNNIAYKIADAVRMCAYTDDSASLHDYRRYADMPYSHDAPYIYYILYTMRPIVYSCMVYTYAIIIIIVCFYSR